MLWLLQTFTEPSYPIFVQVNFHINSGITGGVGMTPGACVGRDHALFSQGMPHSGMTIAGKNIANPTALLLSGFAMLTHVGLLDTAAMIENALLYTLESGVHTGDFGDKNTPSLNTTAFAETIIANFGKKPANNPKPSLVDLPASCTVLRLDQNPMLESVEGIQERIVGVDFFLESNLQPEDIAKNSLRHGGVKFKLVNISNRGTQVWPTGSRFTNLVNQYNVRFEAIDDLPLNQQDIIGLYVSMSGNFRICSLELLNQWGEKKGYSQAQGQ